MSGRSLRIGYAAWMVALSTLFYAAPSWHMVTWALIGLSSTAAVVVGIRLHRPQRALPWWLVAAALFTFTAGDTSYNFLTVVLGQDNPFPSVADLIYQLFYALLVAALLTLPGAAYSGRDRASILDALTLTAAVGLLSWLFLINPYIQAPGTGLQKGASISLVLWDVLIIAAGAQLVASVRRTPAAMLLFTGAAGMLVSDVYYALSQLQGSWHIGGAVDVGWIVYYAAWGAAALQPSMRSLTAPVGERTGEVSGRRLLVLALSSLVPPVVLLVEGLRGEVVDAPVIALTSALIFLLVLTRLAGVVQVHRQAVARERGLRRAGAALVSAATAEQVAAAVRTGVAQLLPAGSVHRVVLAPDDEPAAGGAIDLVPTAALPPALAEQVGDLPMALCCTLPAGAPARAGAGTGSVVLCVAAEDTALRALRTSVEVLAAQAALALERIRLTQEVNRRASEEYFRTLIHNAADVILILNEDNTIRYASPSATAVFGPGWFAGRTLRDLVRPEDRAAVDEVLDLLRSDLRPRTTTADWTVTGADGRSVQVEAACRDLRGDATVGGIVVTLRDVTEQRRLESELTHQAFHDTLTGLANRVLFQERLEHAVARSRRTGAVVGMLYLDLDDFKLVNDTMGHAAGDELLVAAGRRLAETLRSQDTVARLGGDEFAALIEDAHRPEEIEEVARRVVAAFAEPFPIGGLLVNSSVSVGVTTTAEGRDGKELLRQADLALYVAKGDGKSQWRRYQAAVHMGVLERMELRTALSRAAAEGAFMLQYQAIVSLATGRTVGMEALVRWEHPTRGAVPPGDFIELAEESGLIVPIGAWVLRHALADAARWAPPQAEGPYVSVNVSARQFHQPGFVAGVREALQEAGLSPRRLVMEITETMLLRDDEEVWAELGALRELGVRVAIDDFGTGYSSLSYLRRIPSDLVKIERSFIESISTSPAQLALVEGIVRLAHTLDLEVVAEGIERPADRDLLAAVGCQYGQGYLFSPPLSYGDAVRWLSTADVAV